jgi:hypothetical protein
MRALLFLFALSVAAQAHAGSRPRPAHGRFTTNNYTLTVIAPPGLSYCPVPRTWVGSDHGTILFLIPPSRCGGVGYAASDRGALPANLPHIEIYYGFSDPDSSPSPPCEKIGEIRLLRQDRAVCAQRGGATIVRTVTALYKNDTANQLSLTLVTTPKRLASDMAVFTRLVEGFSTCTSDMILPGAKRFGSGPRCKPGDFY